MSITLPLKIAGLSVRTSGSLATDPNLKFCGLVLGPPKVGKTTFLMSLAQAIEKYEGKSSLIIACEPADGGGLLSIASGNIPFVQPTTLDELKTCLTALASDRNFGGVFLDNAGEVVSCLMKPVAMSLPSREGQQSRSLAGVPERSDYQTMGELFRRDVLLPLINLSKHKDPAIRKHIVITTLPKEKLDKQGNLLKVLPDLPGAMALAAQALVQFVGGIEMMASKEMVNNQLVTTKKRFLISERDAYHDYSDRYNVFPPQCPTDMVSVWEKYWVPRQKQPDTITEGTKEQTN